jgi:NAD(P)-dependent dehydrogenase (short-subunit alcohol dehydrogenase family)
VTDSSASRRSVVVTGCGRGIGRAIVERLRADGYALVGIEHDRELAIGLDVVVGDSADPSVHEEAAVAASELAPLSGWVNNAAIMLPTNLHEPVRPDVERVLAVDLLGYYWGCAAAVKTLVGQRSPGAIVNISSIHGRAAYSDAAAYDIAKAGVDALTRYVAVGGIRANAIAPGGVRTALSQREIDAAPDPELTARAMARPHPLRRLAEPAEIASVAAFLISTTRPSSPGNRSASTEASRRAAGTSSCNPRFGTPTASDRGKESAFRRGHPTRRKRCERGAADPCLRLGPSDERVGGDGREDDAAENGVLPVGV